jgi:hypothetical protein
MGFAGAFRVTPVGTLTGTVSVAPLARDVVGSDPNRVDEGLFSLSAAVGWQQRLTRRWTAGITAHRLSSPAGTGHLGTLEAGGWLAERWGATAGVRSGSVPSVGIEALGWAGLTRALPSGGSVGTTVFLGTDFDAARSLSIMATAGGTLLQARVPLRASVTRGWATSDGFWQATLLTGFNISLDRELTAEVQRFTGASRVTTLRLGARLGF